MPRVTEKPLTTAALQKFYEAMETGIKKAKLSSSSKQSIMYSLTLRTVPVAVGEGDALPVVDSRFALPANLSELRECVEGMPKIEAFRLRETDEAAALETFKQIAENALKAAREAMEPTTTRSL